jgi:hypothetical protein
MRRWAAASALLGLALHACTTRSTQVAAVSAAPESQLGADAEAARATAIAFLESEARGDAGADSLLVPGADFLVTGIRVAGRPRLAGINGPGAAAAEEASVGAAGALAWVVLAYRVTARTPALSERARATFVLEKQSAGWRIRHVHSSMVERWER